MLCCVDSGFCYIPQKSINIFIWVGFPKQAKKKKCFGLQLKSVQLFYSPCAHGSLNHMGKCIHGMWGLPFRLSFFWFPHSTFLLGWLWWFQTLAFSPSDQKEWISAGVAVVPSSSNCDLFLGEKPQKQERSSTPFPPSESQLSSGICLPPFIL